jgi:hypothetical protein
MNHFSQQITDPSQFPDTFPLVILHFSCDIGDGSISVEVPLIPAAGFPCFA